MKAILTILCVVFCLQSYTQINKILDERNGFKDFKIGDDLTKWKQNLKYVGENDDVKAYDYIGDCCKKVFSHEIETIRLHFYQEKIYAIEIYTEVIYYEWIENIYHTYEDEFILAFGRPNTMRELENAQFVYQWWGTNITLELKPYYGGIHKGKKYAKIFLFKHQTVETGF